MKSTIVVNEDGEVFSIEGTWSLIAPDKYFTGTVTREATGEVRQVEGIRFPIRTMKPGKRELQERDFFEHLTRQLFPRDYVRRKRETLCVPFARPPVGSSPHIH